MYHIFPFNRVEKNSRIIIYGAGIAGRNFFEQVKALNYCEVLFLVDKNKANINYSEIEIKGIDEINQYNYDYVVISIIDYSLKLSIKEELISIGVLPEKIIADPSSRLEWDGRDNYIEQIKGLLYANNTPILNYLSLDLQNDLTAKVQRSLSTALLHQKTFGEHKNMYTDKSMVLVGAGPSVNKFKPIPDAIYVGLNRAFLYKDVVFDYLFSIDKAGIADYYEEFFNYRRGQCIKFIGDQNLGLGFQIPESLLIGEDIRRYKTTAGYMPNKLALDISSEPLGNYETVSLQAMQFMLYTNPARIYLVGIDCNTSTKGHFVGNVYEDKRREENTKKNDEQSVKSWLELKSFIELYYPSVEIISVNPVGLKGIFKDYYQ